MDAKGIIKHKEINDSKTAFSVDDALSILLTSKIPLFDKSVLEGKVFIVYIKSGQRLRKLFGGFVNFY